MIPSKNLPMILNLAYIGYNRALPQKSGARGDFQPIFNPDGTVRITFCNSFIQYVCNGLGYADFNDKMANEIMAFMSDAHNGWVAVSDSVAQAHANDGVLVIAGWANPNGHGHINLILPGILERSPSWGKNVPKCANVGKDVFLDKELVSPFH